VPVLLRNWGYYLLTKRIEMTMLGRKHSEETKKKMRKARAKQNPQPFTDLKHTEAWKQKMSKLRKGVYIKQTIKMGALHNRMRARIPKPNLCQCCGKRPPWDLANISQEYTENLSDWEWLCRGCHMRKDRRMGNLKHRGIHPRTEFKKGHIPWNKGREGGD